MISKWRTTSRTKPSPFRCSDHPIPRFWRTIIWENRIITDFKTRPQASAPPQREVLSSLRGTSKKLFKNFRASSVILTIISCLDSESNRPHNQSKFCKKLSLKKRKKNKMTTYYLKLYLKTTQTTHLKCTHLFNFRQFNLWISLTWHLLRN